MKSVIALIALVACIACASAGYVYTGGYAAPVASWGTPVSYGYGYPGYAPVTYPGYASYGYGGVYSPVYGAYGYGRK
ncbi:shematrin-like protein 1 [Galendromus occidentalis]|uniref:Shematrin-like protein 1 n=1 Tax=Galendromus occidentalis TaxID=34638 RepID=A0AAJ7L3G8_9ACAR|nr:shematrin-like protein 1 [Galendromus occidentalis]